MFVFDFLEFLPWLVCLPFVIVPVCYAVAYRFSAESRARRLGYDHHLGGVDISQQFVSEELQLAYYRGQRLAARDERDAVEYRKQREDKRLLRGNRS